MTREYTKEELWKIFERLPKELKEAIFSEETAEKIFDICNRNKIVEGEKMSQIAKCVGRILMGLLPPSEFQKELEKELNLEKKVAKEISKEIEEFILSPLKPILEKIYGIEILPSLKTTSFPTKSKETQKDIYREPIE